MINAFMIAFCIFAWGVWSVTQRMSLRHMTPMSVQITGLAICAALAPIVWSIARFRGTALAWNVPGIAWTFASCLCVTGASFCFLLALGKMPAYLVTGFTSIYPAFSVLLCWWFLNEPVTLVKMLGIGMIVGGTVVLAQ